MKSRSLLVTICLLLTVAVAACVSIDSRALREEVDVPATKNVRAAFLNVADYRSRGELLASASIAEALGLPAKDAAWAYVWRVSEKEVLVRFVTAGKTIHEHSYHEGIDLRIMDDQRIVLAKPTVCGGRDSPGFGCGGGSVALFINPSGQLAAVETGGGAGVLGIIPIAIYAKHLAVFRRIDDAPSLAAQ